MLFESNLMIRTARASLVNDVQGPAYTTHILKFAEVPIFMVALAFSVDALTLFKSVLSLLISYWRQAFSRDCLVPSDCMFEAAAAVVISRTSCMYLSRASSSNYFRCILCWSAILHTNEPRIKELLERLKELLQVQLIM